MQIMRVMPSELCQSRTASKTIKQQRFVYRIFSASTRLVTYSFKPQYSNYKSECLHKSSNIFLSFCVSVVVSFSSLVHVKRSGSQGTRLLNSLDQ